VYREPVHNVVVVTRYDDIVDAARRPESFSSILAAYGPNGADRGPVPAELCRLARQAGSASPVPPGRLRAEPALLPAFIEEVLRFDPPVRGIFRVATGDTEIGGVPVAEGSIVQILWGSGNRDAAALTEADAFDPGRFGPGADREPPPRDRPILAFGHGIHLCPGAPLARPQIRIAFEELLARLSILELAEGNSLHYFRRQTLRGLTALWLDLRP
jgi:cytochrome P450